MPPTSRHEIVIVWGPAARFDGGLQFQLPLLPTVNSSVTGSDSSVMVIVVPGGASPKNSGETVLIISPLVKLSIVTISGTGVESSSGMSKPLCLC